MLLPVVLCRLLFPSSQLFLAPLLFAPFPGGLDETCASSGPPVRTCDCACSRLTFICFDARFPTQVCHQKGVPAPIFARVTSHEEIREVVPKFGFPLIVKPSSGAGSDGVYRCESVEVCSLRLMRVRAGAQCVFAPGAHAHSCAP